MATTVGTAPKTPRRRRSTMNERSVKLENGSVLTIAMSGSVLLSTRRDREFVEAIIEACEQYEAASALAHETSYGPTGPVDGGPNGDRAPY